jgi:hypothetical protein
VLFAVFWDQSLFLFWVLLMVYKKSNNSPLIWNFKL